MQMSQHLSGAWLIPRHQRVKMGNLSMMTWRTLSGAPSRPHPFLGEQLASSEPAELHDVRSGDPGHPVFNLSQPVAGPLFLPLKNHMGGAVLS